MGWASGSGLLEEVWYLVRPHIEEKDRVDVLFKLMKRFADLDCDTLSEIVCEKWPETRLAYIMWEAQA